MSYGNVIIIASNPRGVFLEGKIAAAQTPKPGTIMQIQASAGLDGNQRYTFEMYNRAADGNNTQGPLCVLLDDPRFNPTTAYAAGDACRVYVPVAGEELNCLIGDVAGTGDDHAFGDILMVDDGTGELIATTGTPESEPFMLMEVITDPTADTLARVIYSG